MRNNFIHYLLAVLLLSSLLSRNAYTQGESYYATDSSLVSGVKIIDRSEVLNAQFCHVEYTKEHQQFTPYEVSEYGMKDGRVYIARDIEVEGQSQRVFLERLVEGPVSLYYFAHKDYKTFFMERGEKPLIEISRKSENRQGMPFGSYLASLTSDCENLREATQLVRYNKASLTLFFKRYNTCEKRPFPAIRIGLVGGLNQSQLRPSKSQEFDRIGQFNFTPVSAFTFGLFTDLPLFHSDFSLHIEALYSQVSYYYSEPYLAAPTTNSFDTINQLTYTADRKAFTLPVLLTYAYPSNKIRPFIRFGAQYTYNADAQSEIEVKHLDGGKIEWFTQQFPVHQIGIVMGAGVSITLWDRHLAFIDFRHNYSYDLVKLKNIHESNLYLLFGFSFSFGNNY